MLGIAALLFLALGSGGGRKAQDLGVARAGRRRTATPSRWVARREALQQADLVALWRLAQNEAPGAAVSVCAELCWAAIHRADAEGVSVAALLMPGGAPTLPEAGRPPGSTWAPVNGQGRPVPAPAGAARTAASWLEAPPRFPGATAWLDPSLVDERAARAAVLRQRQEDGAVLTAAEQRAARFYETAQDRREGLGTLLGRVGRLEFFTLTRSARL